MVNTIMEQEAFEAAAVVEQQFAANVGVWQEIICRLAACPPPFAITIGRGSSDHACTFAKYLLETKCSLATVSAAPSVLTLYGAELQAKNALVLAISQSGKSPDICDVLHTARKAGALTVAIVNTPKSPLAKIAEFVVPMHAGEEQAVAATKSYLASLASLLQFTALWSEEKQLLTCLSKLPQFLLQARELDWSAAVDELQQVNDTLVLARGYGFPVAQEAALKFKETAAIQAEAFSGAEVLHGPFALIKRHPYLLFTQSDNSLEGMLHLAKRINQAGGRTLIAASGKVANYLPATTGLVLSLPPSLHPLFDPLMVIQAFYMMVARLAVARGYNPDQPELLRKVTETV